MATPAIVQYRYRDQEATVLQSIPLHDMTDPLVEPETLWQWLSAAVPGVIVADCRYRLTDPSAGYQLYQVGHIPGAHFLDLNRDLSGPPGVTGGGRHPLPDAAAFRRTMERLGLTPDHWVIAYDDEGSGAARLWWLLKFYGHDRVAVLNGGYSGWVEAGFPMSRDVPSEQAGQWQPFPRLEWVTSYDVVASQRRHLTVIDARAPERFRGEVEPIDPVAGHIPGAINVPYQSLMSGPARFLEKDALVDRLPVSSSSRPVIYCGSGVSACVNVLAFYRVGRQPVLYAGSWSDWISHPGAPIARGESQDHSR